MTDTPMPKKIRTMQEPATVVPAVRGDVSPPAVHEPAAPPPKENDVLPKTVAKPAITTFCTEDWRNPFFSKFIESGLFFRIYDTLSGVRIHLREFESTDAVTYGTPTENGIAMTPQTFYEFSKNAEKRFRKDPSDSFIANNQLLAICEKGRVYFKEIVFENDDFNMKTNALIAEVELVNEILNSLDDFKRAVIKCIVLQSIPEMIRRHMKHGRRCSSDKCGKNDEDGAKRDFYKAVCDELLEVARENLVCDGCSNDHSSQKRHQCMMTKDIQQNVGSNEKCHFYIKPRRVAESIFRKFCVCRYAGDFFDRVSYEDYGKFLSEYLNVSA